MLSCRLLEPLTLDCPLFLLDARISCRLDERRVNANFSALISGSFVRGYSNAALFGGAHHDRLTVITEVSGAATTTLSPPWELSPLHDLKVSSLISSSLSRDLVLDVTLDYVFFFASSATP